MEKTIENFSSGLFIWQTLLILALILPIIALIDILRNDFKDNNKLIWILVILFTNLVGVLLYLIYGTKQKISKKIA
ncbi:PLD nuclease N-terminal domain-containing protein [uncultured Lutibacter sp.]|uniref:PLD nuclease N-terminal domain-containing protein n=1 Tax=uncultured Lutibacter sp. TaxID=437739 RepID=UPI00260AC97F|nr:PLD nuclease N-terminal domain-containing protein [uncultured Lutibacter sp.]